jgi:DNA-binding MarR family transcriptional regulator
MKKSPSSSTRAARTVRSPAASADVVAGTPQWHPAKAPLTVSRPELLPDGTDRDFRRLVEGLFPFSSIHTAVRDGHASILGLTGPQYTILLCIRSLGSTGPVSIKTLADHLRFSGSYITAEIKALVRDDLVSKERGEDDRRMVSLSLTPKSVALLDSIAGLRRQVNDVQFECLSSDEFKMLVPLIERLIASGERALTLQNYLAAQFLANGATEEEVAA